VLARIDPRARRAAGLLACALALGCDRLKWNDEPLEGSADTEEMIPIDEPAPEQAVPPRVQRDAGVLPPLERAKRKLVFPAKGATHLGFNLQGLQGVHALAGAVEIPEWAAPGDGDTRAMRDDDLGASWGCTPELQRPCAIGVHLATAAQVKGVRIYGLAPGAKANDQPRIAKLRLHTDDGWADAELPDEVDYAYVLLGKPVQTHALVIEVLETRGRGKGGIRIADLEVYGVGGTARDPIEIDPAKMIVRHDGATWTKDRDGSTYGHAFLETLADDGTTRRMMPGTAIYGRASDRIQLIERLDWTDCRTHRGSYYMLDRITRVQAPVGDLGGIGGQVFRSRAGNGFASGYVDEGIARLSAIVLEGDAYKHRRTQRVSDIEGPQQLIAWEMDSEPSVHGGNAINEPPPGCALGSDDTVTALGKVSGAKAIAKPGEWMVCSLGGKLRAFVTDHGPCGKAWELTVLDGDDRVVATRDGKRKGARLRLRRWSDDALLVEVSGDDDETELVRVDARAITSLGRTSFAALPPAACRARCDDPLRNPARP
jgi:hypothetical protein